MNERRKFLLLIFLGVVCTARAGSLLHTESHGPQFLMTPPLHVKFSSMMGVTLNCVAEGTPTPTINWLTREGRPLESQPLLLDVLHNASLSLHPFAPERYRADIHAGTVRCGATNEFGTIISPQITLDAVVWQDITIRAEGAEVAVAGTAVLRCMIPSRYSSHVRPVSWETQRKTIYPSERSEDRFHMLGSDGTLLVKDARVEDQTTSFVCKARDSLTQKVTTSLPAEIKVTEPTEMARPSILNKRHLVLMNGEASLSIPCVSTGTPTPTVRWGPYPSLGSYNYPFNSYSGGMNSPHIHDRALNPPTFPGSAVLNVEGGDGQAHTRTFVCTANNSLGIDQMTVEVRSVPIFSVSVTPPLIKADLDSSVTFTCSVSDPKASVQWYKNGSPFMATGRILHSGRQLIISAVTHEDSGMIQCLSESSGGAGQGTAQLKLGDSPPVLIYQFIEQTLQTGPTVSLRCNAVGNPLPHFKWTLNGLDLPPNGRVTMHERPGGRGEVVSTINISDARIHDGGVYRCIASNRAGSTSHEANLNIYGPPTARQVGTVNAVAGKRLTLFCPVSGYPITGYSWTKDGISVGADGLGRGVTGNGVLVIDGVKRPRDEGVYSCRATNREGRSALGSVQVAVLVPPKIAPFPAFENVVEGERKTQTCTVSKGDTPLTLTWLRDERPLALSGPAASDVSVINIDAYNSVLSIKRVAQQHAGTYTCRANNAAESSTLTFLLVVNVPPRIDPFAFQKDLSVGMRTRVICGVSEGDPPLTLTWLKDGEPLSVAGVGLPGIQVKVIDAYSRVLTITPLQLLHAGQYACEASNSGATVRFEAPLVVQVAPSWVLEPVDTNVIRGHPLVINCLSRGTPEPTHVWKKKIEDVVGGVAGGMSGLSDGYRDINTVEPTMRQLTNGSLFVPRVEPGHAGIYVCHASNNVSKIDKTIRLVVQSAPYFVTTGRVVDSRSGENAVLECRVRGDPAPTVMWLRDERPMQHNHRYKEGVTMDKGGDTVATLQVSDVDARDGGEFSCLATNTYGKNYLSIHLNVHEPPTPPLGLYLVSETSRSVRLSWSTPTGAKPITYIIQYKRLSQRWSEALEKNVERRDLSEEGVEVKHLQPATRYTVRVIAGNHLGRSSPSEELVFSTAIEKPAVPPREVSLKAMGPNEIKVQWKPPMMEYAHGQIQGYNIGYAPKHNFNGRYNFTTVDSATDTDHSTLSRGDVDVRQTVIRNLRPFTSYEFVVQAFNSEGNGPLSTPKSTTTLEDAPTAPPRDVRCTPRSKDSLHLSWLPPGVDYHNGVIRGYRVEYERENSYDDLIRHTPTTPQEASAHNTVLTNLIAATNYSIRINSYTSAGEGPWAAPISCSTNEDIPGRPDGVRGVVSGPGQFIVSWGVPQKRGGFITSYTVNWNVVGSRLDLGRGRSGVTTLGGDVEWVQIEGVMGTLVEVDVMAATRVGNGPSASARVTLTTTIPAAIYSLGGPLRAQQGDDVNLRCGYVGEPKPHLEWKHRRMILNSTTRKRVKADGTLELQEIQREDSGNYTCTVSNKHGSDHVTYLLSVFVPPEAPLIIVSSSASDSILVQWKKVDDGGAPITGFVLNYRKDNEPWNRIFVHRYTYSYILKNLDCGSRYHVFVISKNIVGSSPASKVAVVRTLGGPPLFAPLEKFVVANSTEANVYTKTWVAQGCPITLFSVEYRRDSQLHWVQVSGRSAKSPILRITGLEPATLYHLRATADSSAGTSSHTYQFTTLTTHGEIPNQLWDGMVGDQWLSVRVLLPLLTSAVALASSLGLVCYCVRKKQLLPVAGSSVDSKSEVKEGSDREKTKESKYGVKQRDQFYATIRKTSARDSQSDVPENASDIYPYATFQMPNPSGGPDIPMYSIYHSRSDQKSGSYSKEPLDRHTQNRVRTIIGDSEDYETMVSDTETALDDYETEHGVSSRTESSNHLEDLTSMREHSLIYTRGVSNEGLTQGNPMRAKSDDTDASTKVSSSCGDTIYGGGPLRSGQQHVLQQRIHHNLLYHAESSTSPEQSPTKERKSFPRKQKPRTRGNGGGGETDQGVQTAVSIESIPTAKSQLTSDSKDRNPKVKQIPQKSLHFAPKTKEKSQDPQEVKLPQGEKRSAGRFFGLGKKRTNSSGSMTSRKSSKGSVEGVEVSETECDRAIVPPPRSYSDANYAKGGQLLNPPRPRRPSILREHQRPQLQPEPHKRPPRFHNVHQSSQTPHTLQSEKDPPGKQSGKGENKDFSISV